MIPERAPRTTPDIPWASALLKAGLVLVVLVLPALWSSCSVAENYETLSFWFDGVPTPEQLEEQRLLEERIAAAEAAGPLTSEERAAMLAVRVEDVYTSNHKPVEENLCDECHIGTAASEASNSGWISDLPTLIVPKEELCLRCHEPLQGAYTHGPSASGNCSTCHYSHQSAYPHLLRVESSIDLCSGCHDPADYLDTEMHEENAAFECVACHDPHASEQEYLLHADYPRLEERAE